MFYNSVLTLLSRIILYFEVSWLLVFYMVWVYYIHDKSISETFHDVLRSLSSAIIVLKRVWPFISCDNLLHSGEPLHSSTLEILKNWTKYYIFRNYKDLAEHFLFDLLTPSFIWGLDEKFSVIFFKLKINCVNWNLIL